MTTKPKKTKTKLKPTEVLEIRVEEDHDPMFPSYVTYRFPGKHYITKRFDLPNDALSFARGLYDAAKEDGRDGRIYVNDELTRVTVARVEI